MSLALAAISGVAAYVIPAQAIDWLGTTADYNAGGNWSGGVVPNSADTVTFDGTAPNQNLTFSAGTTFIGPANINGGNYSFTTGGNQLLFLGPVAAAGSGAATIAINDPNGGATFAQEGVAGNATVNQNDGTLSFLKGSDAGSATINVSGGNAFFLGWAHAAHITISGGTAVFEGGSTGDAFIANTGGTLRFVQGSTPTTGRASITNSSIFTFENNGADNAAIINQSGGQLQFLTGSDAGNATISNNNGGILEFSGGSAANAQIINSGQANFLAGGSAASALVINNTTGVMGFSGASAANATLTNSGQLQFLSGSNAGWATIINNSGGMIEFSGGSAANAIIANSGQLQFLSGSNASSATITNNAGGTLDFSDTSAANADIVNNGQVRFSGTSDAGNATITNNSGGTVDFSNSTGILGTHILTAGSIAGAGTYDLGQNLFVVGSNNLSTEASGRVTGLLLIKVGTGSLTLSGHNIQLDNAVVSAGTLTVSGANAELRNMVVSGGTLLLNSAVRSLWTTVNSGGTLGGMGSASLFDTAIGLGGEVTVNGGGTLAPGDLGQSIGVFGAAVLTMTAGSSTAAIYSIDVSPAASDLVRVGASANVEGTTVLVTYAPGQYVPKRYVIVSADGSVNGPFGSLVNVNKPVNLAASLSYDIQNAYLNLTLDYSATVAAGGANHQNVANALMTSFNTTGNIPAAFVSLDTHGLAQASGPAAPTSQVSSFQSAGAFMSNMTKFSSGAGQSGNMPGAVVMAYANDDSDSAYVSEGFAYTGRRAKSAAERDAYATMARKAPRLAAPAPRWSTWVEGYGGMERTEGKVSDGTATTTSRIYGLSSGFVYHQSLNTQFGFALGGGQMNFGLAEGLGGGSSDFAQAGASARHTIGAWYVTSLLGYGWQRMTTDRNVGADALRAQFNVNSVSGRFEVGHRIDTGAMGVTPYAAGQFTTLFMPAYAEQIVRGTSGFALSYAATTVTSPRSEVGVRTDKSFAFENAAATLFGRAAWAYNYNTTASASAAFQSLPGSTFTVNGAALAPNAALVSVGIETAFRNGWTLTAAFEGEFSSVTESYVGKGMAMYRW